MEKKMTEKEMLLVVSKEFEYLSNLYCSSEAFYNVLYRLLDELDKLNDEYHPRYLDWNVIRDLRAYARTQNMSMACKNVDMKSVNLSITTHVKLMLSDLMQVIGDK